MLSLTQLHNETWTYYHNTSKGHLKVLQNLIVSWALYKPIVG